MLTRADLDNELHRLVQRGLDASLDPAEIADALQAELDKLEVRTGEAMRSSIV